MATRFRPKPWTVFIALSGIWLLTLALLYWLKPDSAAALTIFPAWTWVLFGLLPLIWWRKIGRLRLAVIALWLIFTCTFCEEWTSLIRSRSPKDGSIRVVSLNCAGGLISAAEEVATFHPDIILLQESPGRPELEKLLLKLYGAEGSLISGPDASILCRWKLTPRTLPLRANDFVSATCDVPGKGKLDIVSLRLMPPSFRVDLISPSAWTDVAENRRLRREELREIVAFQAETHDRSIVIGGDFNAQSGDAVFRVMPSTWKDSFYEAGSGWCHTAVNDYPLARIDQIWIHEGMEAQAMRVHQTVNSDHRMVVMDFQMPSPK